MDPLTFPSSPRQIYREWAPQIRLLSKIPTRIHRNIVGYDLNLTCIAVHSQYIAIGTNAGLVYWYCRKTGTLKRLWCADRTTPIAKVALVETVDFMVAAANTAGQLSIFQIPKPLDPTLVRFTRTGGSLDDGREAEFFTIPGAHSSTVTSLEWAVNGMKLFSGDQNGEVFMTEIDFITRTTSTTKVSEEGGPIVQLSYFKQLLLISSTLRSCLCFTNLASKKVEVGSQPRKVHGNFGGTIFFSQKSHSTKILVGRPRHTLYEVNSTDGKVQATILLKSLIEKSHSDIPLVNPSVFQNDHSGDDAWRIQKMNDDSDLVCLYSSSILHIVDPFKPAVLSSCNGLRKIIDLSVYQNEIFVLEGHRSLVRISQQEDIFDPKIPSNSTINPLGDDKAEGTGIETITNMMSVDSLTSKLAHNPLTNLGDRIGNLFKTKPQTIEDVPVRSTSPAEEVYLDFPELRSPYSDIVVHKPSFPSRQKLKKSVLEELKIQDEVTETKPSPGGHSVTTDEDFLASDSDVFGAGLRLELQQSPDDEPDESYEGQSASDEKEARLFRALSLEKFIPASFSTSKLPAQKYSHFAPDAFVDESTFFPEDHEEQQCISQLKPEARISHEFPRNKLQAFQDVEGEPVGDWIRFVSPCLVDNNIFFLGDKLFITNKLGEVFFTNCDRLHTERKTLRWEKAAFRADKLASPPSGEILWRLYSHCAWAALAFSDSTTEDSWTVVHEEVQDLSLSSKAAWIATFDGNLYLQTDLNSSQTFSLRTIQVEKVFNVRRVAATDGFLLALSEEGQLFARLGISSTCKEGTHWVELTSAPKRLLSVEIVAGSLSNNYKILLKNSVDVVFFGLGSFEDIFSDDGHNFNWYELDFYLPCGISNFGACFGPRSLVLGSRGNSEIFLNDQILTGMIWNKLKIKGMSRYKEISAGGIYKLQGLFWALLFPLRPRLNELYFSGFQDDSLDKVQFPYKDQIIAVAAAPEALWVLTLQGKIYIRTGMDRVLEGNGWKELNLDQLASSGVSLSHISLSSDAAWAVDTKGAVWLRLGPVGPPGDESLPVWIPVDGGVTPRGSETITTSLVFTKIYSSASGRIVWAIDNEHNVYMREGIFPDVRQGVDWYLVSGMTAVSLAVSDITVWALSQNGFILRRVGMSENNCIGDAWKKVSDLQVTTFSATICNTLFGVDLEGNLHHLITRQFSIDEQKEARDTCEDLLEADWTIVK